MLCNIIIVNPQMFCAVNPHDFHEGLKITKIYDHKNILRKPINYNYLFEEYLY